MFSSSKPIEATSRRGKRDLARQSKIVGIDLSAALGPDHPLAPELTVTVRKAEGITRYYLNDDLHRADGPAVEDKKHDRKEYWLAGRRYSSEDEWEAAKASWVATMSSSAVAA